jgi:CRP/FNR family cyclic AMP-dependent transcriptional regulator
MPMMTAADRDFLRGVALFCDLDEADLAALWPHLRIRRLRRGEALFREGDPGQEMFLIRSGTIIVSKLVQGRVEQVLNRQEASDFFGEMSLFDEEPRSATILAETDVVLLGLDGENLRQLIDTSPRAAAAFFHQLVRVLIKRLRSSTALVSEITRWGLEATGLDVEQTLPE